MPLDDFQIFFLNHYLKLSRNSALKRNSRIYRNYSCISHTCFHVLSLKFGDAYYTQEVNINFLSGYVHQDSITEFKLYLCSKRTNIFVLCYYRECVFAYNFVSPSRVELATLVEGDPKVPFSIAITPKCRGGCYSILWIVPLYLWSLPYNTEC